MKDDQEHGTLKSQATTSYGKTVSGCSESINSTIPVLKQ